MGKNNPAVGQAALGIGTSFLGDAQQYLFQGMYNDMQQANTQDNMRLQKQLGLQYWKETGPVAQMEQYKKAGLNPALMYGMGGGGGQSAAMPTATGPGGNATKSDAVGMGIQLGLAAAQQKVLESQANLNNAEAAKKAGADTANVVADTANKEMQNIILKYGGKEAERQWNIDKELQLEEYGAKANEYEARKAAASQLVALYENGTMQKMTEAELQNKLKELGIKELTIEKTKLENAILELEKNMQTTLGIDKNAPTWLRIIGRLVMSFMK